MDTFKKEIESEGGNFMTWHNNKKKEYKNEKMQQKKYGRKGR